MAMQISFWQAPPQRICLETNQLHLWRISLHVSDATQQRLKSILSADESARVTRLLDRQKATTCCVARGRLRQILARYLNLSPAELNFSYGKQGKPALQSGHGSTLEFNLSHSGEWALLAVTASSTVGVDLERIDPLIDWQKIAQRFFTPSESIYLNNLPRVRQRREFYRIWTAKEAGLKRTGSGFSRPVSEQANPCSEKLHLIPIAKDYLGAILISPPVISLQRYHYPTKTTLI